MPLVLAGWRRKEITVLLAAVTVRIAAAGLKAQPAERHVAAAALHRDATGWIRVAEDLARWAAKV
jgi:hypothetical protein